MSNSTATSAELSHAAAVSPDIHSITRQKTVTQTGQESFEKMSGFKYGGVKSHTVAVSLSLLLIISISPLSHGFFIRPSSSD